MTTPRRHIQRKRMTSSMRAVLAVIVEAPAWGYTICEKTGLGSGVVYPALERLMKAGLITDRWEGPPPGTDVPVRRFYDPAYAPWWYEQNGILNDQGTRER